MLSWEKCNLHRKTNLRLSFTREERVNMGCGSEAEKHRASTTKMEVKSCLMRHSASKEIPSVLVQRQKGRRISQTPECSRYIFTAWNRLLLLQNQCLHGNRSISLITSTWSLQQITGDQWCCWGLSCCLCSTYRKKDTGCLVPSQISNIGV